MKTRILRTVAAALIVLGIDPAPAVAYYDDVHYALTYYIARQTGYTPQQAFRIASACSSVDWDEQTEPVQAGGQAILLADRGEGLIDFTEFGIRVAGKFVPGLILGKTLDRLDDVVTAELTIKEFRDAVTKARFKFHAFRDELEHEQEPGDVIGDGPNGLVAQGDVTRLLDVEGEFFQAAVANKNLGAWLHAFEDEVPHRGYGTTWGHNPFPPDSFQLHVDRKLSIGSTTDWVSHRRVEVDFLTMHVNSRLIRFMQRASPHQTWRDHAPDTLRYADLVSRLARLPGNEAPTPMSTDMQRQIFIRNFALAKGIDLSRIDGAMVDPQQFAAVAQALNVGIPVADIKKHLTGPAIGPAVELVNAALGAAGMSDRLPLHHYQYDLDEEGEPAEEQLDDWVLVGSLILRTRGPAPVTATLKVVIRDAAGKEKEVPVPGFDAVVMRPGVPQEWLDLPIGDVIAELQRENGTTLRQMYTLSRRVNEFPSIFIGDPGAVVNDATPKGPTDRVPLVIAVNSAGVPLSGALVKIEETRLGEIPAVTGVTDVRGRTTAFALAPLGSDFSNLRYKVTITAPGYESISRSLPGWWFHNLETERNHTTEQTINYSLAPVR